MDNRVNRRHLARAAAMALSLATWAALAAPHNSRGDAEAVLHAFLNGGRTTLFHADAHAGQFASPAGGPLDELTRKTAIRPLSYWEGAHLCVDDWHVILLGIFSGGDQTYKREDFDDELGDLRIRFDLDGHPLENTTRTPVMRFHEGAVYNLQTAYGFQQGQIMKPGEIGVGEHTLKVTLVSETYGTDHNTISFHMDPSRTGACK